LTSSGLLSLWTLTAGVAALLGALIGGAGTLVGSLIAEGQSNKRATRSDERSLRDKKLDRLRDAYVTVQAATGQLDVVWSLQILEFKREFDRWMEAGRPPEGESKVTLAGEVLGDAVRKARESVLRSLAILQLETGDRAPGEVISAFNNVLKVLDRVARVLQERDIDTMGHDLVETTIEFGSNEGGLREAATRHLAALEQPL
jgi:hypothetical protein